MKYKENSTLILSRKHYYYEMCAFYIHLSVIRIQDLIVVRENSHTAVHLYSEVCKER